MGSGSWIVLELSSRSEGEDPKPVTQAIRNALGKGVEVYIPAAVTRIGDDQVVHYLVGGYAFVRGDFPRIRLNRLENTRYVQAVLSSGAGYATVTESEIDKMRIQLRDEIDQGIGIGDKVLITTGHYRNIEATVIEDIPELKVVQVFVQLRSKETIQTIPRSGLKVLERAPMSPVYAKLTTLRLWTRRARPVLGWDHRGLAEIQSALAHYQRIDRWMASGRHLYAIVSFGYGTTNAQLADLHERYVALRQVSEWAVKARHLYAFVASYYGFVGQDRLAAVRDKLEELRWFDDIQDRIKVLRRGIDAIGHKAAKRRKSGGGNVKVIQNVVVDGHNLFFRCLHAPGMSELMDDKGRHTGVIVGVLNSLAMLKKRFQEARIYITWDGSNQRRRKVYPDYKGQRRRKAAAKKAEAEAAGLPVVPVFDQLGFLHGVLPLLGVRQAFNKVEEADDVIASLVHEELSDQHNLIFSTDRDLLQLVSDTTALLKPRVSSRREVMYDLAAVQKEFGVAPDTLIELRAFYGDSSDNIPGVPRVPKKVLRSLVQAYGSVDGVYDSGLTGVTKGQYDRLRQAEPQVRINVELMRLVDVPVSVVDPDVDPDGATTRLREVAIKPDPIMDAFFGRNAEAPEV